MYSIALNQGMAKMETTTLKSLHVLTLRKNTHNNFT